LFFFILTPARGRLSPELFFFPDVLPDECIILFSDPDFPFTEVLDGF
jgi:hypothetical protein